MLPIPVERALQRDFKAEGTVNQFFAVNMACSISQGVFSFNSF